MAINCIAYICMTYRNFIMKQTILTFAACVFLVQAGFTQTGHKRLIYAARFTQNGDQYYDLYDETGKKIVAKPVDWAWSNAWDWIFIGPQEKGLLKAYDVTGTKLLVDSIEAFRSPAANTNRIPLRKNGVWHYYDRSGKQVFNEGYEKASVFTNDMAIIMQDGTVYFIDSTGKKLNRIYKYDDPVYDFQDKDIETGMSPFSSKNYKLIDKWGKTGMADLNNKVIIEAAYDNILDLRESFQLATVEVDGKYGVVSFSNKIVIPVKYGQVFVLNDYPDK